MPTPYQQSLGGLMNPQGPQVGQGPITQAPPAMQNPQPGPPQNPEEMQQRVGGWNTFLERLADPNVSRALIQAGTTMMSPQQPGETQGFKIGQGLAAGAESLYQTDQISQQNDREERRTAVTEKNSETGRMLADSSIKENNAQIPLIQAQVESYRNANSPEMQQKALALINARIDLVKSQTDRAKGVLSGGGGRGAALSGDIQKYDVLRELYVRQGDANADMRAAREAFGPAPKEFALDSPADKAMDWKLRYLSTVPGATPQEAEAAIAKDVQDYKSYYDMEKQKIASGQIGASNSSNDANTRYQEMISKLTNPQPGDDEKIRLSVIRAFGLPQTWTPQ